MTTASTRPHIGLIGCGMWGRNILRDLVSLGCEVSVVARSESSRDNAHQGGSAAVFATVAELPDIDGAVVAAPTVSRPEILHTLLARGLPVFTEKPLAASVAEAEDLVRAADGRLFVMEKWRYHPGIREMAALARSGDFGPVHGMRTTRNSWGINHPDVDAIWTLLPHDISIVDEILREIPAPSWATGEVFGGEPAALIAQLGDDPWVVIEVSAVSRRRHREVRLCCRDATLVLNDDDDPRLLIVRAHVTGEPPVTEYRPVADTLPLLAELRAFIDHLAGGPAPGPPVARSLEAVRTIAALREMAGMRP